MKLIKLRHIYDGDADLGLDNGQSEFENLLSSDFKIAPFSRIGLKNMAVFIETDGLEIGPQYINKPDIWFTLEHGGTEYHAILETDNVYSPTTLIRDIQKVLNNALDGVGVSNGFEWQTLYKDQICSISFDRSDFDTLVFDNLHDLAGPALGVYTKNQPGVWSGFAWTKSKFINGAGRMTMNLPQLSEISFGLKDHVASTTAAIAPADYDFCIYVNAANEYECYLNKVQYIPAVPVAAQANDILVIKLSLGDLLLGYTRGAGAFIPVGIFQNYRKRADLVIQPYYSAVMSIRDNTVTFGGTANYWHKSPFIDDTTGILYETYEDNNAMLFDPTLDATASTVTLNFKTNPLWKLLGYDSLLIEKTAIRYTFKGTHDVLDGIAPQYMYVVLPNIPLDSHDGEKNKEDTNIVSVITQFKREKFKLSYETTNVQMVSMNNAYPMNLNQISCQILNEYSETFIVKSMVLSFIVDEPTVPIDKPKDF